MLLLAVIPGIVLFIIVWRGDKVEKEPKELLWKLFIFGALTVISAIILGNLGELPVKLFVNETSLLYIAIDNFILTALIEEAGKYLVMKKLTWKHPAFNYTFDGVVYAVTASLGFAVIENIFYLIDGDLATAIMRAVFSVPGHASYGVFMGCYYGQAKLLETRGDAAGVKHNLRKALLIPVLLHGFYDFCLSTDYDLLILGIFVFEIVLAVVVVRKFKKLAKEDQAIVNPDVPQTK